MNRKKKSKYSGGKKISLIGNLLFRMYGFCRQPRIRRFIRYITLKLEGGQFYSLTIRRILAHYHNIEIGLYSYGGCFDLANIHPRTKIGRYCSFADGVRVSHANHPITFRSVHPFFYLPDCGYVEEESIKRGSIEIGNDVWIGWNAIILAGVKRIGDGAVIGAGAVVTSDIPDYAVVAGNPARVIKFRFPEHIQESIQRSKWWDKDIEELEGDLEHFLHPLEEDDRLVSGQSREKQV